MKIPVYLFVDNSGNIRVTKRDKAAYPRELAIQLMLDVPDVFFNRPMPKVDLNIPPEFLVNPDATITAKWIAPDIAEAIGVEVKRVEDGMVAMIEERNRQMEEKLNGGQ